MKNALISALITPLILVSCISDDDGQTVSVLEQEKRIRFEFFTDKDYGSTEFETYFVNLSVGISLVEKGSGLETKVLDETTGWIPFKNIPQEFNTLLSEKLILVDTHKYSISYGYSHQVRIGETIQMKAVIEYLNDWESEKTITIVF